MSKDKEVEHITKRRWKWSQTGIPHKVWHCYEIENL